LTGPHDPHAGKATVPERNLLERALGVFAEVRAGEGFVAVLMFVNVFLLLNAYYILKTVREGLIIGGGRMLGLSGAELKIYASAGMAFLLLGVVPAYGALASRVRRVRLLNISLAIVIACLVGFYILGQAGVPLALAYFLWLGIVNVFLIAQFWSYANDIYSEEQGKRLFAIIATGGSLGAIVGPKVAEIGKEHTLALMIVAAVVFAVSVGLYNWIDRLHGRERRASPSQASGASQEDDAPLGTDGGFQLVWRQRYLLLIALMLLVANIVNTTGEFILTATVEQAAQARVPDTAFSEFPDTQERAAQIQQARRAVGTGFYGRFFSIVNLVTFLIQAFLVSRIFKYAGVRVALFILPAIAIGAYGAVMLLGGLSVLRVGKTAENSTDYSLQNTLRQALFLPTSREAKYKAKAAIDTFFVRFGDALAAGMVAIGTHTLALSPSAFAIANVGLGVVWLVIAARIGRHYERLSVPSGEATGAAAR
jgi:AAA family ATP:ADP antiporter